jgi:hypothetical protein
MSENTFDLQWCFFVVDQHSYCLWDTDIRKRTLKFLESVDPSYFEYLADSNFQVIDEEKDDKGKRSQYAALALRTSYSQALETLFALIFAGLQAPRAVPAWMALYKNHELNALVEKVDKREPILSMLEKERLSWQAIADTLLSSLVLEDKEKEATVKKWFGDLWGRLATDFLDQEATAEYNSIKHGLRVRPGGFWFAMGPEDKPGVPAPREKMRLMGKSDFGSQYLEVERLEPKHHVRLTNCHRNWHPEDLAWRLHLISMSVTNVLSALKIINDVDARELQFTWPGDLSASEEAWRRTGSLGMISMKMTETALPIEWIKPFSKTEIIESYKKGKVLGVYHIQFPNSESSNEQDPE